MRSASALVRDCAYVNILRKAEPTDAKGRAARLRRDEAAARGTLFHVAIESWVNSGEPGRVEGDAEVQGWIDLLASKWAPPAGADVEWAWGLAPDGAFVCVDEPEPHVYVGHYGVPLLTAGRADVAWVGYDRRAYVLDWKTGKWPVAPPQSNLQVNAAGIALARLKGASEYVPGIYYARDGVFEWGEPVEMGSAAQLTIWEDIRTAALLDETPRPGPHCDSCWERRACAHALAA